MRNRLNLTVSAAAIAFGVLWAAPLAQADALQDILGANAYVSVFGGGTFARLQAQYNNDVYDAHLKDGFTVGAAIGSYVGPGLRFERELSYQRNKNSKVRYTQGNFDPMTGDTEAIFLLANLWKDIDVGMGSLYVGGGLGTAFVSSKDNASQVWNDTGLALAAQLGAGLRVPVTDRMALDLGYRLKTAIDAPFDGKNGDSNAAMTIYSHNVQLGLSYALGEGSQIQPVADLDVSSPGWYVSVFGGGAFPEHVNFDYGSVYSLEGKTGFTVGAAVGTELAPGLRGELELSYLRHAIDGYTTFGGQASQPATGHLEQTYLLANVWKDFQLGMFSPYIGGGIGFGTTKFNNATLDGSAIGHKSGLGFAGQIGTGVRFGVTDNLALDAGYRFKSSVNALIEWNDTGFTDNTSVANYEHVLQLGLTYGFGEGVNVASAPALEGKYISLFGGYVAPADTHISYSGSNYMVNFKDGFTVGAAVGATIADHTRGELELSHLSYKPDSTDENGTFSNAPGKMGMTFLMTNVWRDFDLGFVQPYGGFGVGMALADVDIDLTDSGSRINDTTLALAAQVGSGIRVPVTDNLMLDVGYRFKAALDVLTEGDSGTASSHGSGSHYAHVGQVGVTWAF